MKSKVMSKYPFCYFQLNALREIHGLDDEDMAKIAGIHPSTYSLKKRGVHKWYPAEMKAICEYFGRSVEGLFWPKKD
jgi:DNA-binding XRE family transcriptional regulator